MSCVERFVLKVRVNLTVFLLALAASLIILLLPLAKAQQQVANLNPRWRLVCALLPTDASGVSACSRSPGSECGGSCAKYVLQNNGCITTEYNQTSVCKTYKGTVKQFKYRAACKDRVSASDGNTYCACPDSSDSSLDDPVWRYVPGADMDVEGTKCKMVFDL